MRMRLNIYVFCLLVLGLLPPSPARPEGHGPSFALATPTLGKGGWSSDTVSMHTRTSAGSVSALGQMFGYGIHEDLQVNFKLPVANNEAMLAPNARAGMMGAAQMPMVTVHKPSGRIQRQWICAISSRPWPNFHRGTGWVTNSNLKPAVADYWPDRRFLL